MGSLQAAEMAEMLDTRTAIGWHLKANHYPSIPSSMIDPCLEAIQAGLDDDWFRLIEMPEGVSYRGMKHAPAHAIIDQHHLDPWVTLDEEFDEE